MIIDEILAAAEAMEVDKIVKGTSPVGGARCRNLAIEGSNPPRCGNHKDEL